MGIARVSATSPLSKAHAANVGTAVVPFRISDELPPDVLLREFGNRFAFLDIVAILGKPNSSSSSSKSY